MSNLFEMKEGSLFLSGKKIWFPSAILEFLQFDDGVAILLDYSSGDDRNVFFLNLDGTIRWQIPLPGYAPNEQKPFTGINSDDGELSAYNGVGYLHFLDKKTGETLKCVFTK